jgi:hypothetical protein
VITLRGFELHRAGVVSGGVADVGGERGGATAELGGGGFGAAFLVHSI